MRQVLRPVRDSLELMEPARVNAERLHERALSDSFWLTALSHTYEQLYMANWHLGDVDAALKAASKCLEFTKLWSDADSGNHEALQRLAVALTISGNASRRLNKLGDAHKAHSSALEIRKGPANADPKNTTVEGDLGISWSRRVDVYWDEADYSHALDASRPLRRMHHGKKTLQNRIRVLAVHSGV